MAAADGRANGKALPFATLLLLGARLGGEDGVCAFALAQSPPADLGRLTVVVPSYAGHLREWLRFMRSIVKSLPEEPSGCAYSCVTYLTVVSSVEEQREFAAALARIGAGEAWGIHRRAAVPAGCVAPAPRGAALPLLARFRVRTLHEVLLEAGVAPPANGTLAHFDGAWFFWLQGAKKLYGCLSAREGTCFVTDSEGVVLRRGVCHAATRYEAAGRTVLYSPYPAKGHTVTRHRRSLGTCERLLAQARGARRKAKPARPSFYAMEAYHWLWRVQEVSEYVRRGLPSAPLELVREHGRSTFYLEECFYHWARPHALRLGLTFVNVTDVAAGVVGPDAWESVRRQSHGNAAFENIFTWASAPRRAGLSDDAMVELIRAALVERGILFARCGRRGTPFDRASELLDLCISGGRLPKSVDAANGTGLDEPTGEHYRFAGRLCGVQHEDCARG